MARRNGKAKKSRRIRRRSTRGSSRAASRKLANLKSRQGRAAKRPQRRLPRSGKAQKPATRTRRPKGAVVGYHAKRSRRPPKADPRLEIAVRELNRGRSLSATARAIGLSAKELRKHLKRKRLLKRKGKHWITQDDRLRRVTVMTAGRLRVLTVRGYKHARLIGEHHHAAGQFVRTNVARFLKRFRGRTVQAANGRRYVLETDPNALHRIAAMDSPPFHEIYEITSNT